MLLSYATNDQQDKQMFLCNFCSKLKLLSNGEKGAIYSNQYNASLLFNLFSGFQERCTFAKSQLIGEIYQFARDYVAKNVWKLRNILAFLNSSALSFIAKHSAGSVMLRTKQKKSELTLQSTEKYRDTTSRDLAIAPSEHRNHSLRQNSNESKYAKVRKKIEFAGAELQSSTTAERL